MARTVEAIGRRVDEMEKQFSSLRAEIDRKSGGNMDEDFAAIKAELSSLSSTASAHTQERSMRLESLREDFKDVHRFAHEEENIAGRLDKLAQSNEEAIGQLTSG